MGEETEKFKGVCPHCRKLPELEGLCDYAVITQEIRNNPNLLPEVKFRIIAGLRIWARALLCPYINDINFPFEGEENL